MLALHSGSVAETVLLSGFVQSIGYVVAAAAPLGSDALHDLTASWLPPLLGMAGVALVIGVAGTVVVRRSPSSTSSWSPRTS